MVQLKRELSTQIYEILRKRITDVKLKPGTRINIQELSEEFQVSPSPIKTALRKLSQRGLVTTRQRGGYYVTVLSTEKISEIYDLRKLFESEALNTSIYTISSKKLDEFKKNLEAIKKEKLSAEEKITKFYRIDQALHLEIIKNCKNETLKDFYDQIYDFVKISQHFHTTIPESFDEHIAIIEAILRKDLEMAKRALEKHIVNAKERTIQALKKGAPPWKESFT
ncbi:GntR family transcriptional regulator [Candidatus Aerophobetes bacterium]|nr:GntR family transcriptional regulator [Candidatus Aerophobetes bacterium]